MTWSLTPGQAADGPEGRRLIEAMGGTVRVEPAWPDDSGTRIVIALPLYNPETAA